MENTERTDAGGTPYHEDEPIKAEGVGQGQDVRPGQGENPPGQSGSNPNQGGKSEESGRIGQGGSELEDEDDENEVGSTRKSGSGQSDRTQNPGAQVDGSDQPPKMA